MKDSEIRTLVEPVLAGLDLDLEAVEVVPAGKRRVLRVVVDGDGPDGAGPSLDDIATATRAVSGALDESDATGAAPYTLEVSSRGVSRPLTLPRHWRRNATRLVKITLADQTVVTGRIVRSDDTGATVDVAGTETTYPYPDIAKAMIEVELNRKPKPAADDGETDGPAADEED